jgi:hypothetical protein
MGTGTPLSLNTQVLMRLTHKKVFCTVSLVSLFLSHHFCYLTTNFVISVLFTGDDDDSW